MSTTHKIDSATYNAVDVITPNTGIIITSGTFTRVGNLVVGNFVAVCDEAVSSSQKTLGVIAEGLRPRVAYNGSGTLSSRQWASQFTGYLFIGESGAINTVDDNNNGCTWVKGSFAYSI